MSHHGTSITAGARRLRRKRRLASLTVAAVVSAVLTPLVTSPLQASAAPVGAGFALQRSDLAFILKQIKISERHVAERTPANPCSTLLGTGPNQIPNDGPNGEVLPWGLRTVDGSCNNLVPGQENFGAADQVFTRKSPRTFRDAEAGTSYASGSGTVIDSQPRVISNLIVDQTRTNPAAVAAAGFEPDDPTLPALGETLQIGNVAPDTGLSAPFNAMFTFFGQFFDHGLDLVAKGGGTIFMPLKDDDPLIAGDDHILGNDDDLPPNLRFMVLTRTKNQPDGTREATNLTTPFVDQNQTYTSHPSHQVFLRAYTATGAPVSTGKLIETDDGMATWAAVKAQARTRLGIELSDTDVLNVPMLSTDPYGQFIPGPNGLQQLLTATGLVEGDLTTPVSPSAVDATRTNHAFLDDIAHHAAPVGDPDGPGGSGPVALAQDVDPGTTDDHDPTTYDDEMLEAHFIAGDGRVNENIALTSVHHIFHSEHNRLADDINALVGAQDAAFQADWHAENPASGWGYGERLFQAAKFVTEMEYQHLVFEEFARKVQPMINAFGEGGTGYETNTNAAISGEFAHAVYRFGHSMLTETVSRKNVRPGTPANNNVGLIEAFLNPEEFRDSGAPGVTLTPDEAAGSIFRAMTRQPGQEIDEFVTEALRNNLLGLPLDLPTINLARARDAGVPSLNAARSTFYAESNNTQVAPYESWEDFGFNLKHRESLVNFVAAYGQHTTITGATTLADKRAAAEALVEPETSTPESSDFMNATGTWATQETGINLVDLWVGGLAEKQMVFGGLLGPTFNYVFEKQLEDLQFADRFYYLARTQGLNLLVQLEGNSFAELVMRNTDVEGFPADVFSRPDLVFNLSNMGPVHGPIQDDFTTDDTDESTQPNLVWRPDGTLRFSGTEHVVFNGSDTLNDRMWASEGDDTLRGNGGDDWMQGGDGNDNHVGGLGDDILVDLNGDDVLKGGAGNDALSSGQGGGGDLNQGGPGKDFVIGGNDITETFGGPGDDFVFAGDDLDTVFGDDGDDWMEAGAGPFNLLQGDSGQAFQDDPDGGHDVMDGDGGEQDYDGEGGDDIMLMGPGIQRAEGMLGFDWTTHKGDPSPANSDMDVTGLLPPSINDLRDRFDLVEALSGWDKDDVLRGDSRVDADLTTGNGTGHALTAEGIARIDGLAAQLPAGATSFTGGNIILGGAGSDLIEGRGGDDIIDGDSWLNVLLRAPDLSTPDLLDTKLVSSVKQLQTEVFAGLINPADITIVRRIESTTPGTAVDTALFTGARAEYTIVRDGATVTVTHDGGGVDGIDTIRNVEQLRFTDQTVSLVVTVPGAPTIGTATAGNAAATVTWTAPASDGNSPITEFRVQVFNGATLVDTVTGIAADATSTDIDLTNGTTYTFRVLAVNAVGTSVASAASNAVTPVSPNPVVTSTSPADDATGVAIGTNVTATFDRRVTSVNGTSFRLRNAATGTLVAAAVTLNAAGTVGTLNPNANLAPGTTYTATLLGTGGTGIRSFVGGNRLTNTSWSFTTAADTTAPTNTARTPASGSTGINRGNNLTATFSERVLGVNGTNFRVRRVSTNALIAAQVTVNAAGTVGTLNPNANLAGNTLYRVTLTGGTSAIRDLAGNALVTTTWTFRTRP